VFLACTLHLHASGRRTYCPSFPHRWQDYGVSRMIGSFFNLFGLHEQGLLLSRPFDIEQLRV